MASVGFRWLDILEKEFDKAFVDLDLTVGELEGEEPDTVYNVRQKLCTLSSCFAQLTHKAQTIFQNSAKIEAELIHMRTELVESKSKHEILEQELHNLILQLHSSQLSQLPSLSNGRSLDPAKNDGNIIKKRLEEELKNSPTRFTKITETEGEKNNKSINPYYVELMQLRSENGQMRLENAALRNSILALNSEVYGAKLAAKYLDKELAGRIQQLQLLGREMRGDVKDKLWRQLESEILLQRHKTVVRACRRNSISSQMTDTVTTTKPSVPPSINEEDAQHFGDVRTVVVKRNAGQGLGISITGGREHGVPILISELEPNGPAALCGQLYIGDAILTVNGRDLRQACHREAVDVLQQQIGDVRLEVQYLAADDSDNSLEEDGLNFRLFDNEVCDQNESYSLQQLHSSGMANTPTAPRTPESNTYSRTDDSRNVSSYPSPISSLFIKAIKQPHTEKQLKKLDKNQTCFNENEENRNTTPTNQVKMENNNNTKTIKSDDLNSNNNIEPNTENITNAVENLQYRLNKVKSSTQKLTMEDNKEENFHCSTNSLVSENFSSPMQTSADIFLDSEVLSTDVTSNDSQSPKNTQNIDKNEENIVKDKFENLIEIKRFNEFCLEAKRAKVYGFDEDLSNPASDQSLLNSPSESCDSSPLHMVKKKQKNKRYFGMKTLQNIFNRHNGYSDISSTASDVEEIVASSTTDVKEIVEEKESNCTAQETSKKYCKESDDVAAQFEQNIHAFLSETFSKSKLFFDNANNGTKFYPNRTSSHNIRIGKALRLTNSDQTEIIISENNKDKYTRYVSGSNVSNIEGIGDPNFGTPV